MIGYLISVKWKKTFLFWFLVSQHLQNTYCCYYGVTKLGKPVADTLQACCFGSQFLDTSLQDCSELPTIMWQCGWSRRAGTFLEAGGHVELLKMQFHTNSTPVPDRDFRDASKKEIQCVWGDATKYESMLCFVWFQRTSPLKHDGIHVTHLKEKKKKQLRHKNISPCLWYMQTLSHLFTFSQGSGLPPGLAKDYRAANMWKGGSAHCALM